MEGLTDGRTDGHDVWLSTKFSPIDDGLPYFLNNGAPRPRAFGACGAPLLRTFGCEIEIFLILSAFLDINLAEN